MGGAFGDRLRQFEDDSEAWLRERAAQASQSLQDLEHAGREAWNTATRAGIGVAARTPQELRALGARVLDDRRQAAVGRDSANPALDRGGQSSPVVTATVPSSPTYITKPSFVGDEPWNAIMQADAAVRGAANVLTFGGADHFAAAMDALVGGGVDGWSQRYEANLAQEHARNQYDASHRSTAQKVGQVGGTLLGVGLMGPADGTIGFGTRLPGAAALTGREAGTLLGAGAGTGVLAQTVSDIATGRSSSVGDMAGAALGGAADVAALPLGPGRAGALGGWVTSAARDLFNGRPIALDQAGDSAMAGGLFGDFAGRMGTSAANDLSTAAKGRLGETLGDVRSAIGGQPREWAPKARDYISPDTYWYPDGLSGSTRFEDKFGYGAELSPNQTQAQTALGSDFKLFHFIPDDIGSFASVPAALFGQQAVNGLAPSR